MTETTERYLKLMKLIENVSVNHPSNVKTRVSIEDLKILRDKILEGQEYTSELENKLATKIRDIDNLKMHEKAGESWSKIYNKVNTRLKNYKKNVKLVSGVTAIAVGFGLFGAYNVGKKSFENEFSNLSAQNAELRQLIQENKKNSISKDELKVFKSQFTKQIEEIESLKVKGSLEEKIEYSEKVVEPPIIPVVEGEEIILLTEEDFDKVPTKKSKLEDFISVNNYSRKKVERTGIVSVQYVNDDVGSHILGGYVSDDIKNILEAGGNVEATILLKNGRKITKYLDMTEVVNNLKNFDFMINLNSATNDEIKRVIFSAKGEYEGLNIRRNALVSVSGKSIIYNVKDTKMQKQPSIKVVPLEPLESMVTQMTRKIPTTQMTIGYVGGGDVSVDVGPNICNAFKGGVEMEFGINVRNNEVYTQEITSCNFLLNTGDEVGLDNTNKLWVKAKETGKIPRNRNVNSGKKIRNYQHRK